MASNSVNYNKDPAARLDYRFDWSLWLMDGETITASVWTLSPGITKDGEEVAPTNTMVWLKDGTTGQTYQIENKVTTNQGRVDERSFNVRVTDR